MNLRPLDIYLLAIVAIVLALAGLGVSLMLREAHVHAAAEQPVAMRAGAYDPPQNAPDFVLLGSDGDDVTIARYRGKVVLMSFGFTYCAAVCPTTLATLAQARESLGADADAVQVIFVTVDPERDDVAHMRDYLAAFGDGFIGATGSEQALAAVREDYGVTAVKEGDGPDYVFGHTSSIFLIDRDGSLRAMMPYGRAPADFVHDIRFLLRD